MSEGEQPGESGKRPRRVRYTGRNPRRFEDKYKEHQPEQYPEVIAKVRAAGKTPAGHHVPILVAEILEVLAPKPGERAVDCTLGFAGHACALLPALQPGGVLLGFDRDPLELGRSEARLRALGFSENSVLVRQVNFAGLGQTLAGLGWDDGVDLILADLGASSMQFDNPVRGFSFRLDGPLDMRMNPGRGITARDLLRKLAPGKLETILRENGDEPRAEHLALGLAGKDFPTTRDLAEAVRVLSPPRMDDEERETTLRRVFQALRIEVNEEFSALEALLRQVPACLRPGGRIAILTFHSGEDRRVKHAFREGLRAGWYVNVCRDVIRASPEERRNNPRSSSAKLRWAIRGGAFPGSQP